MTEKFDLGIIGGGPAGYTAALHAASLGQKVVLFEKEQIGGVCLNKGCIPTKSIMHSSEVFQTVVKAQDYGISTGEVLLDFSKVQEKKEKTILQLRKGIELALKNAKVRTVITEAEKIQDLEFDQDSLSVNVPPVGSIKLRVVNREEPKCIKFETEQSPIPFNFWIQLLPVTSTTCKMKLTIKAELNIFIKQMVKKPLQEGIEKIADVLQMIQYN